MSTTTTKDVAERLVLTRHALGLIQAEFARRIGVTPQALNNYERGVSRLSIDAAGRINQTFGVTSDWLFHGRMQGLPGEIQVAIRHQEANPTPPVRASRKKS